MMKSDNKTPQEVTGTVPASYDASQHRVLRELIMGFRNTQLIAVASKLNIAAHLKDGPKTAEHLAEITNTNPRALYRLLRALTSIGLFEEGAKNTFFSTPIANLLCDQNPHSLRNVAILYGEEWVWKAYNQLGYSVEKGQPAFNYVHGASLYEYLEQDHIAAERFNNAMSAFSGDEATAICDAYSFSSAQKIIDIGGGHGAFVLALSKIYPHLSGTVFDQPGVIDTVKMRMVAEGNESKISYASGDFFREVPGGGDIYVLKSILHNWDDQSVITILGNCRKAMKNNGKLLIIERVVPSENERSEAKLFDINMLLMTGGQERKREEYSELLSSAGYNLSRVISTRSPVSVLEAIPKEERPEANHF